MHHNLGRRARVRPSEQPNHLIAEEGRARRESEKNNRAEPHRRVQNRDDSQKSKHARSVELCLFVPSFDSVASPISIAACVTALEDVCRGLRQSA